MSCNVRIGINPISWMNDDLPSLGGDTLLETALAEGREIGYEGFELGNKFPSEGPALQAKLAEAETLLNTAKTELADRSGVELTDDVVEELNNLLDI